MTSDRNETAGFDGHAGLQNESGTLRARVLALASEWQEASHDASRRAAKADPDGVAHWQDVAENYAFFESRLRALLAEPAAEDLITGPMPWPVECDHTRATCEEVGCPNADTPSVPAPAADCGEVEALARSVARVIHRFDCEWCDECSGPNFNQQRLAREIVDSLADLRRTERAEGAREAAERYRVQRDAYDRLSVAIGGSRQLSVDHLLRIVQSLRAASGAGQKGVPNE